MLYLISVPNVYNISVFLHDTLLSLSQLYLGNLLNKTLYVKISFILIAMKGLQLMTPTNNISLVEKHHNLWTHASPPRRYWVFYLGFRHSSESIVLPKPHEACWQVRTSLKVHYGIILKFMHQIYTHQVHISKVM